jgi:hypothetical protein
VINNSMVGVSKLLHFINPERYAIWDRRVASYPQRTYHWSGAYLDYLALCHTLVGDARFLPVHAARYYEQICDFRSTVSGFPPQ